jgi:hypothetical protein
MQKLLVVTGQEEANKHGTAVMSSAVRKIAGAEGILDLTGQCWMRGYQDQNTKMGWTAGRFLLSSGLVFVHWGDAGESNTRRSRDWLPKAVVTQPSGRDQGKVRSRGTVQ